MHKGLYWYVFFHILLCTCILILISKKETFCVGIRMQGTLSAYVRVKNMVENNVQASGGLHCLIRAAYASAHLNHFVVIMRTKRRLKHHSFNRELQNQRNQYQTIISDLRRILQVERQETNTFLRDMQQLLDNTAITPPIYPAQVKQHFHFYDIILFYEFRQLFTILKRKKLQLFHFLIQLSIFYPS